MNEDGIQSERKKREKTLLPPPLRLFPPPHLFPSLKFDMKEANPHFDHI